MLRGVVVLVWNPSMSHTFHGNHVLHSPPCLSSEQGRGPKPSLPPRSLLFLYSYEKSPRTLLGHDASGGELTTCIRMATNFLPPPQPTDLSWELQIHTSNLLHHVHLEFSWASPSQHSRVPQTWSAPPSFPSQQVVPSPVDCESQKPGCRLWPRLHP